VFIHVELISYMYAVHLLLPGCGLLGIVYAVVTLNNASDYRVTD